MAIFSFLIMCLTLLLQGIYFWARDKVTPDPLPIPFIVSDLLWAASLIPLLLYRWYPLVTVVSAWILFLSTAIILAPYAGQSVPWFFWKNSLVITNLVFAHVGLHLKRKRGLASPAHPQKN
jgi:hypothetical protein